MESCFFTKRHFISFISFCSFKAIYSNVYPILSFPSSFTILDQSHLILQGGVLRDYLNERNSGYAMKNGEMLRVIGPRRARARRSMPGTSTPRTPSSARGAPRRAPRRGPAAGRARRTAVSPWEGEETRVNESERE